MTSKVNLKRHRVGLLIISPFLAGLAVYYILPILMMLYSSVVKNGVFSPISSYLEVYGSGTFRLAVKNTILFTITGVTSITIISLLLSVVVNKMTFYKEQIKSLMIAPLIEIQPDYYLAMSTSFESTINDKVVKAIYSKGNIGYFLNGNYGEVLDDDKVYIGKDVSYDIFKTTDIVGMDIIVDKKVRRITSVSDLEKIDYYDRGTQVVLSGKINSDIKFSKLILSTKDRKGKNITFENIRKYLDKESNIRCISRDEILNSINATRESMKLICILILALWVYKNHSVLNKIIIISFLAILVCFIYSMEWALLPIDLINENLVSLSYLIETITKAPDQMYKIMQTPMTIDTFKLLGISIVQISGYIIALAIVIANFTLKDIVKKECKNEKSSSVDYDADSCF